MKPIESSIRRYRFAFVLFTALTGAFAAFTFRAYSLMPERIPIHFDGGGVPDRWSGREEFLRINLSLAVLLFLIFGLGSLFIPGIPPKWLNLPNKDYWLTPERKERSFADLNFYYLAMGILTLLLLGWVGWSAFEVAMGRQDTLRYSWTGMGVYFCFLTVFCILLYRRFGKKAIRDD